MSVLHEQLSGSLYSVNAPTAAVVNTDAKLEALVKDIMSVTSECDLGGEIPALPDSLNVHPLVDTSSNNTLHLNSCFGDTVPNSASHDYACDQVQYQELMDGDEPEEVKPIFVLNLHVDNDWQHQQVPHHTNFNVLPPPPPLYPSTCTQLIFPNGTLLPLNEQSPLLQPMSTPHSMSTCQDHFQYMRPPPSLSPNVDLLEQTTSELEFFWSRASSVLPPPASLVHFTTLDDHCEHKQQRSNYLKQSIMKSKQICHSPTQMCTIQGPFSAEPCAPSLLFTEDVKPIVATVEREYEDQSVTNEQTALTHIVPKEEPDALTSSTSSSNSEIERGDMLTSDTPNHLHMQPDDMRPPEGLTVTVPSTNAVSHQSVYQMGDILSKIPATPLDPLCTGYAMEHDSEMYLAVNVPTEHTTGDNNNLTSLHIGPFSSPNYLYMPPMLPILVDGRLPPGCFPREYPLCTTDLPPPLVTSPRKKGHRNKRKRSHSENSEEGIHQGMKLWQFLLQVLVENKHPTIVRWTSKQDGTFKVVDSEGLAKLWGGHKNRPEMNYDKMSRAMRYYYNKNLLDKVPRRLYYQFKYFSKWWEKLQTVEPSFKMTKLPEPPSPPVKSVSAEDHEQASSISEDSNTKSNSPF